MTKVCEICGHIGLGDLLLTCSKCRVIHRHCYCFEKPIFEFPRNWICEDCLKGPSEKVVKESMQPAKLAGSSSPRNSARPNKPGTDSVSQIPKWQKNPDAGKVKQISAEEVIRLSSGTGRRSISNIGPSPPSPESAPGFTRPSGLGLKATGSKPNSMIPKPPSVDLRPPYVIPKPPVNPKPYLMLLHSTVMRPSRHSDAHISSKQRNQSTKSSEVSNEKKAPVPHPGESSGRREFSRASMPIKQTTETRHANAKTIKKQATAACYANAENIQKQATFTSPSSSPDLPLTRRERKSPVPSVREHERGRHVVDTDVREVGTSSRGKIKAFKLTASVSPSHSPPITCPGGNANVVAGANNSDFEEKKAHDDLQKLRLYRSYLPALHATWKGGFLDSATPKNFYGGFRAQPPCKVHRKAYEFSKKLPLLLKIELLPRGNLLVDLFEEETPDLCGMALYFFPDENIERSKEHYIRLFEVMETQNSAARSYLDDVELLIFTSKQLEVLSRNIIRMQKSTENFLWGVFRRSKSLSSPVVPPERASSDVDNSDVIDMDIDMEGGKIVDNVETAVPKEKSGLSCGRRSEVEITDNITLQIPTVKIFASGDPMEAEVKHAVPIQEQNIQPPNSEKPEIWTPPPKNWVKLNVEGVSKSSPFTARAAGVVRDELGRWVFGYILSLGTGITRLSAEFWAIYQGLKFLWKKGYRQVLVESTLLEAVDSLKQDPAQISSNKSIIQCCQDMIMKTWECRVYAIHISRNLCANWLANRFEDYPVELVLFDYPPRSLIRLLENDRKLSASTLPPQER